MILAFNKPFGVLCQFTDKDNRPTLKDYVNFADVYSAGRLDRDSEGLLLLTDSADIKTRIADPKHRLPKRYLALVEGTPRQPQFRALEKGVQLNDGLAKAEDVELLGKKPGWVWRRDPPVRARKHQPAHWIALTVREGRNRMIRRMTAAVDLPTLRLIRTGVGSMELGDLPVGTCCEISADHVFGNTQ